MEEEADRAAMGYLTLGRRFNLDKHDIIDDRIDVVFRGIMGLTVSCARCHDHVYDPISSRDYYGIYGVFASSEERVVDGLPPLLVDRDAPADSRILVRGIPGQKGEPAPRRYLSHFDPAGEAFVDGSGRLELALGITSRDNPLTARVFVNRVWTHLLGRPLVETPSDFGLRTDEPAHLALLDELAAGSMVRQTIDPPDCTVEPLSAVERSGNGGRRAGSQPSGARNSAASGLRIAERWAVGGQRPVG